MLRTSLTSALVAAILLVTANSYATDHKLASTIDLPKLLSLFMTSAHEDASWVLGAENSGKQISWSSIGVEDKASCGSYESCRKGFVRVKVNNSEMRHLRAQLEPIEWEIYMASTGLAKFGPEIVHIEPQCDTVQCAFDLRKALAGSEIKLTKLCGGEFTDPGNFSTVFLAQNAGKSAYISYSHSQGSGGASNDLTVTFKKPSSTDSLCAEAKSESMAQALPPSSSVEAEWYSPSIEKGECTKAEFVKFLNMLQKTNTRYTTEDTIAEGQIAVVTLTVTWSGGVKNTYRVFREKARCERGLRGMERQMKDGLDKYR